MLYKEKYELIIDDEKYTLYIGDNYPGNDLYWIDDNYKFPDNTRSPFKEPQKLFKIIFETFCNKQLLIFSKT